MDELAFHKMHGLGNDFVILDRRSGKLSLSAAQTRRIADRRLGVGCDQLLSLEPSERADVFMRVYNPDGSESGACGNGTRCVARLMMEERGGARDDRDGGRRADRDRRRARLHGRHGRPALRLGRDPARGPPTPSPSISRSGRCSSRSR